MDVREWVIAIGAGILAAGAVAYTFYRSWTAFALLLIPAGASPWYYREYWRKRRLAELETQFKEMIQILSASLSAGYSVENAIDACGRELEMMYGAEGMIVRELNYMSQQLNMNRPIEVLMNDFARRSSLDEVENFARIFAIAKRSGGRLVSIISHTVRIMNDRFQVKEEIRTLTASSRFEQRIMNLMPFLMILYIDGTSPGFFETIYTTVVGRLVMSGCLVVYGFSCYLSGRILDIKVG